jgi:hypothetical protein
MIKKRKGFDLFDEEIVRYRISNIRIEEKI